MDQKSADASFVADSTEVRFLTVTDPSQWRGASTRSLVRAHVTRKQHERRRQDFKIHIMTGHTMTAQGSTARRGSKAPVKDDSQQQQQQQKGRDASSLATLSPTEKTMLTGAMAFRSMLLQDSDNEVGENIQKLGTDVRTVLDRYRLIIDTHAHSFVEMFQGDGMDVDLVHRTIYPFIFTGSLPMSASLLLAASYMVYERGDNPFTNAYLLRLRSFVMQKIHLGLSKDIRLVQTDQLVNAVVKMARYEAVYGRPEHHATHMRGLVHILNTKGGLNQLGLDGMMERMILFYDAATAAILGTAVYCHHSRPMGPPRVPLNFMHGSVLNEEQRRELC